MDYRWTFFLALFESQTESAKFQLSPKSLRSGFLVYLTTSYQRTAFSAQSYKTRSFMNFLSAWILVMLCAYVCIVLGRSGGGLGKCCSRLCDSTQGLSEQRHNARKRESEEDGRRSRMCASSIQNHNELKVSHFR